MVYRATGLAGIDGDALVIGPPYIVEEEQLDVIVEAIVKGLAQVTPEWRDAGRQWGEVTRLEAIEGSPD